LAAFTNNWSFLNRILAFHGLSDVFDIVVNSADVGSCKPDTGLYSTLLTMPNLQPCEVIIVDDRQQNIDVAQMLGFRGIRHINNGEVIEAMESLLNHWLFSRKSAIRPPA
jgi:putative hydrolase of the HAD superfamily